MANVLEKAISILAGIWIQVLDILLQLYLLNSFGSYLQSTSGPQSLSKMQSLWQGKPLQEHTLKQNIKSITYSTNIFDKNFNELGPDSQAVTVGV